jgi:hypothetical protein
MTSRKQIRRIANLPDSDRAPATGARLACQGGKRISFTGDLGFENQDILHRCWDDADKARLLVPVIRNKLLAWRPDIVFTGHGVRTNGTEFIAFLLRHTEESLKERSVAP